MIALLKAIVLYNIAWNKQDSIKEIKQLLTESGAVWQKFAQMLSGHGDIIGVDLANELSQLLVNCPTHSKSYSKRIIREMFGDRYNLEHMKLIGSGTIAQVYKVGDNCIKVRHPDAVKDIMDAASNFNYAKDFMPVSLKAICDLFFKGLVEQLDLYKEFNNGTTLKKLLHGHTDGSNNLFIVPRMVDVSRECLVMEYEQSHSINENIDKHVLLRFYKGLSIFQFQSQLIGLLHADMHMGNYGIRNPESPETMRIVLYDFGHMYDIRDIPIDVRETHLRAVVDFDSRTVLQYWLKDNKRLDDLINTEQDAIKKISFQNDIKRVMKYIMLNGILLDKSWYSIMVYTEKTANVINALNHLDTMKEFKYMHNYQEKYGVLRMYEKYFPFDDTYALRNLLTPLHIQIRRTLRVGI